MLLWPEYSVGMITDDHSQCSGLGCNIWFVVEVLNDMNRCARCIGVLVEENKAAFVWWEGSVQLIGMHDAT